MGPAQVMDQVVVGGAIRLLEARADQNSRPPEVAGHGTSRT